MPSLSSARAGLPEHDMVVVVTGGTRSRTDQQKPIQFLYSHILPAVQS